MGSDMQTLEWHLSKVRAGVSQTLVVETAWIYQKPSRELEDLFKTGWDSLLLMIVFSFFRLWLANGIHLIISVLIRVQPFASNCKMPFRSFAPAYSLQDDYLGFVLEVMQLVWANPLSLWSTIQNATAIVSQTH